MQLCRGRKVEQHGPSQSCLGSDSQILPMRRYILHSLPAQSRQLSGRSCIGSPPCRTIVTLEAGAKERLDANPVTCFDLFYCITQLFDNAHDFVARYYWQARRRAIFFQSSSIRCRFDLQTPHASISRISPVLPFIVGLSIDISLSGCISICASFVSTIARIFSAMEPLIPFLHLC